MLLIFKAIPLKDKRGIRITNAFQKILNESKHKANKIWVDKGSKFYNRPIKLCLEKSDIEMYSMHNERKHIYSSKVKLIIKILDLKLVILLQYQNIKIFLQKAMFQIDLKKFLWLKKLKMLCCEHMLLLILRKEIVGTFYEKELQKNK